MRNISDEILIHLFRLSRDSAPLLQLFQLKPAIRLLGRLFGDVLRPRNIRLVIPFKGKVVKSSLPVGKGERKRRKRVR